ncbi:esterase family protein [bacterium]|nr:esterase family protein [bacterium]
MHKILIICAALLAFTLLMNGCGEEVAAPDDPTKGNVIENTAGHYMVYTPPGYSASGSYPVIYLLHGFGGDENYYINYFNAPDASDLLIDQDLIYPMIIVMPSGHTQLGGNFYTNSTHIAELLAVGGETSILDVMAEVEADYAVDTNRRAIAGHSMGGYGALSIAMNNPGMFAAISVIAAPISFWGTRTAPPHTDMTYKGVEELLPSVLTETGYNPSTDNVMLYKMKMYPSPDRIITSMMFAMAYAFSPTQWDLSDPMNPIPQYVATTIDSIIVGVDTTTTPVTYFKQAMWVDLPIGFDGFLDMGVWSRWLAHDCLNRLTNPDPNVNQMANIAGIPLYLDVGADEPTHGLGLNGAHQVFFGAMQAVGLQNQVTMRVFEAEDDVFGCIPAGHTEHTFERVKKLLMWNSEQLY